MNMIDRDPLLDGGMIPRAVRRTVEQRTEERRGPLAKGANLRFRGQEHQIWLINLSTEGAMIAFEGNARIGEGVTLDLGEVFIPAFVRWRKDGRMGLNFTRPLTVGQLAKISGGN